MTAAVIQLTGYAAATNAEIAREAGVTAAALYYYFPSKAELFRAAVSHRHALVMPELQKLHELRDMPPEELIPLRVRSAARIFADERIQALIRLLLAEGPRNPELVQIWSHHLFSPVVAEVLKSLTYQMDRGAIRRLDPRVVYLMAVGSLLSAFIVRDLLRLPYMQDLNDERLVDQVVEALLYGLLKEKPGAAAQDHRG